MVSITVSVPPKVKELMKEFSEVNWSGFVKKSIEEKVKRLAKFEELKKDMESEQETVDWSVKLQRASRNGRLDELKRKGLI